MVCVFSKLLLKFYFLPGKSLEDFIPNLCRPPPHSNTQGVENFPNLFLLKYVFRSLTTHSLLLYDLPQSQGRESQSSQWQPGTGWCWFSSALQTPPSWDDNSQKLQNTSVAEEFHSWQLSLVGHQTLHHGTPQSSPVGSGSPETKACWGGPCGPRADGHRQRAAHSVSNVETWQQVPLTAGPEAITLEGQGKEGREECQKAWKGKERQLLVISTFPQGSKTGLAQPRCYKIWNQISKLWVIYTRLILKRCEQS